MRIPSIIMLYEKTKKVNNIRGSSFLSPAHGRAGARAIILFLSVPPPSEKIAGGFQQAGKKEGGWGEGIFARLLSAEGGMGWESVSAILPLAEYQNRKIFFSLIEKNWGRAIKKMQRKFFCFARRSEAEVCGNAGRDLFKIRLRIFLEKSSDFV